jgi:hypothetical protein
MAEKDYLAGGSARDGCEVIRSTMVCTLLGDAPLLKTK